MCKPCEAGKQLALREPPHPRQMLKKVSSAVDSPPPPAVQGAKGNRRAEVWCANRGHCSSCGMKRKEI